MEEALQKRWGIEPNQAKLLARLSKGCLGWAIVAAADEKILQQRAQKLENLYAIIRADTEERFHHAAQLAARYTQNRAAVGEILDLWLDWWRDLLLVGIGCPDYVTNTDQMKVLNDMVGHYTLEQIRGCLGSIKAAERQLKQNANPRLVLEVLMLDMPGRRALKSGNLATGVKVTNG